MEPASEALAARITKTRDELSDNIDALGQRVKNAVDWRRQYQRHTAVFLTAAVLGGALLSQVGRSGRRPVPRQASSSGRHMRAAQPAVPSALAHLWGEMKAAAVAALANRVYAIVTRVLPSGAAQEVGKGTSGTLRAKHAVTDGERGTSSHARRFGGEASAKGNDDADRSSSSGKGKPGHFANDPDRAREA